MYDYKDRLLQLQQNVRDKGIDYYYIPLSDYHNSEIPNERFNLIEYLTGFSGSNATLIVTPSQVYMWTDGRYFIQAEMELEGSDVILMKQGLKGVLSVEEFLDANMGSEDVLAFDGKVVNVDTYKKINNKLLRPNMNRRICDVNLVNRDSLDDVGYSDLWILADEYSGETVDSKISRIREDNNFQKTDAAIISNLCDIAWTLNLRGDDIDHVKVFYSYLIITNRDLILYANRYHLKDVEEYLEETGVEVRDYNDIYRDLSDSDFYRRYGIYKVLIDIKSLNTSLYTLLNERIKVLSADSIPSSLKCIKNDVEISNTTRAHIKDGVAVTKFMYFLSRRFLDDNDNDASGETEISLSDKLHELRAAQEGFIDESFATISAWAEHGAIVHYEATPKTDMDITGDNFYLVDSGGHYLEGTTDITRTFLIGKATPKMIRDYTLVLKSNINLAKARFLSGTTGKSLDALSRNVLWQEGIDFLHGTGHGVGHILSVHEGPNNISFRNIKDVAIKPGMITTDEPGIYLKGEYGIRLENELLCVEDEVNSYGTFYRFECLTLVPFQLECIDIDMLTEDEKEYLNNYHKKVYDNISPYLKDDERIWLKNITKSV